MATGVTHDQLANAIRPLAMDAVESAKSGHRGLPMGAAVLFSKGLKRNSTQLIQGGRSSDPFIGVEGAWIDIKGLGAGGPYKKAYGRSGITPQAVADSAVARLGA